MKIGARMMIADGVWFFFKAFILNSAFVNALLRYWKPLLWIPFYCVCCFNCRRCDSYQYCFLSRHRCSWVLILKLRFSTLQRSWKPFTVTVYFLCPGNISSQFVFSTFVDLNIVCLASFRLYNTQNARHYSHIQCSSSAFTEQAIRKEIRLCCTIKTNWAQKFVLNLFQVL